jgi:hypothetical protein
VRPPQPLRRLHAQRVLPRHRVQPLVQQRPEPAPRPLLPVPRPAAVGAGGGGGGGRGGEEGAVGGGAAEEEAALVGGALGVLLAEGQEQRPRRSLAVQPRRRPPRLLRPGGEGLTGRWPSECSKPPRQGGAENIGGGGK